jgi:hypothetical protein
MRSVGDLSMSFGSKSPFICDSETTQRLYAFLSIRKRRSQKDRRGGERALAG